MHRRCGRPRDERARAVARARASPGYLPQRGRVSAGATGSRLPLLRVERRRRRPNVGGCPHGRTGRARGAGSRAAILVRRAPPGAHPAAASVDSLCSCHRLRAPRRPISCVTRRPERVDEGARNGGSLRISEEPQSSARLWPGSGEYSARGAIPGAARVPAAPRVPLGGRHPRTGTNVQPFRRVPSGILSLAGHSRTPAALARRRVVRSRFSSTAAPRRSAGSAIRGPDAGVTPQWAAGDQGDSLVTASANLRKRAPFHPERTRSALRAAPDRVAMLEGEGPMGPVVAIPGVEVLEELGKRCPGSAFRVRRGTAVYSIEVALLTDGRADQRAAIQRFRRD